ncbi:hypothetical protein B0H17DRAFT_1224669 [Mycena rosella]|uniref:F-box domain-containing protein n=1 Tax=Mycena rosella TaxID=1033263 RepID=A0AAD7M796_MYCRO|nr:hypothetical protein B0H17DRAFT_1224669 [Mycena rosella]
MTPRTGSEPGPGPTESTASERAADRARVERLEAQILELQHTLGALQQEKDLVQGRLDTYTYPVLTLPNEIVSEIFVNFLPVYPQRSPLSGPRSPALLAQICRKWRAIALETWTRGQIRRATKSRAKSWINKYPAWCLCVTMQFYPSPLPTIPVVVSFRPSPLSLIIRVHILILILGRRPLIPTVPRIYGNYRLYQWVRSLSSCNELNAVDVLDVREETKSGGERS